MCYDTDGLTLKRLTDSCNWYQSIDMHSNSFGWLSWKCGLRFVKGK